MKGAIRVRWVLLASLALTATDAVAQTPARSFEDLQPGRLVGERVIIKDNHGGKMRCTVVSLVGDRLEIERTRWFFRRERRIVLEGSVRRIEIRDSTLNGALIGLGAGAGIATLAAATCEDTDCGMGLLLGVPLFVVLGWGIGAAIDEAVNRPVFISPQTTRVTLSPVLGRDRIGLAAGIRF